MASTNNIKRCFIALIVAFMAAISIPSAASAAGACGGGSSSAQVVKGWKGHGVMDDVLKPTKNKEKLDGSAKDLVKKHMVLVTVKKTTKVKNFTCKGGKFVFVGYTVYKKGEKIWAYAADAADGKVTTSYATTCGNKRTGQIPVYKPKHKKPKKPINPNPCDCAPKPTTPSTTGPITQTQEPTQTAEQQCSAKGNGWHWDGSQCQIGQSTGGNSATTGNDSNTGGSSGGGGSNGGGGSGGGGNAGTCSSQGGNTGGGGGVTGSGTGGSSGSGGNAGNVDCSTTAVTGDCNVVNSPGGSACNTTTPPPTTPPVVIPAPSVSIVGRVILNDVPVSKTSGPMPFTVNASHTGSVTVSPDLGSVSSCDSSAKKVDVTFTLQPGNNSLCVIYYAPGEASVVRDNLHYEATVTTAGGTAKAVKDDVFAITHPVRP